MELREWIANDHASVLDRFDSAVAAHVPTEFWKQRVGDRGASTNSTPGPSIAWLLLHTTYHQDLAMNTAIRDRQPMFADRRAELGLGGFDPAAGLAEAEDSEVTDALRLVQLRAYVQSVNSATSDWIAELSVLALDSVPASSYRLEHRAGIPSGAAMGWLHSMWQAKAVSWLLQWECIGHGHGHVGEMVGIRNRLGFSPF